ncbi:MAG TPA: hypothetical protein VEW03_14270 [Longimicrobiaceae bacterium]|nr:hypothetical protein [Longimicrobiaceae bacterium]
MIRRSSKDIDALMEGGAVERASWLAFQDAVRRHRQGNVEMVFWEDGKMVLKSPFDVVIPGDDAWEDADGE